MEKTWKRRETESFKNNPVRSTILPKITKVPPVFVPKTEEGLPFPLPHDTSELPQYSDQIHHPVINSDGFGCYFSSWEINIILQNRS